MTRSHRLDYAGPGGRTTLTRGRRLGPNWHVQPKLDGAYCHLTLDACGRISQIVSRTGQPYRTAPARSLLGVLAGYPHSELVGELDDHTQQGLARYRHQGFARVHIFDCVRIGRDYLAPQPYATRRHRLHDMIGDLENSAGSDTPWTVDHLDRAHDPKTGQYCRRIPASWRRLCVVPQQPARTAEQLWDEYVEYGGEGLVFVAQDAPMGKRGAKKKVKPVIDLDCVVHVLDPRRAVLHWVAGNKLVVCSRSKFALTEGEWVTILCDGFYDDGRPRHARIERVRRDLQ